MTLTPSFICSIVSMWCGGGPNPRRQQLSAAETAERAANADRICCPVIGTLYKHGWLHPTPEGRVTWQDIWAALRIIGFDRSSKLQATHRSLWFTGICFESLLTD